MRVLLRIMASAIRTERLTKRYGETLALDSLDLDVTPARTTASRPQRRRQDDDHPPAARAAPADRGPRGALRHRRLARSRARPSARRLRGRRALPLAVADRRGDLRVPRTRARRHRRRLPRRAGRALPARHRQEGARAVEGQPPEGAARRGVREPPRPAHPRRADQRPRSADGGRLPRHGPRGHAARPDRLPSSHILSEVEALCDRVGILRDGRLVEQGTLSELRHLSAQTVEITFDGAAPALPELPGVNLTSSGANAVRAEVTGSVGPLIAALAGHPVLALDSREPSLEEIFLHHYDGADGRVVQEDLLQGGLAGVSAKTGCPARAAMRGPTLPVASARTALAPELVRLTPGSSGSAARPREGDLDRRALRWRSSASVPSRRGGRRAGCRRGRRAPRPR